MSLQPRRWPSSSCTVVQRLYWNWTDCGLLSQWKQKQNSNCSFKTFVAIHWCKCTFIASIIIWHVLN
jgi:hypothetical protein